MAGFSFQTTKVAFYGQNARDHLLLLTYEKPGAQPVGGHARGLSVHRRTLVQT